MKIAAAQAIASVVPESQLRAENMVTGIFNPAVIRLVARGVAKAAYDTGVARSASPAIA